MDNQRSDPLGLRGSVIQADQDLDRLDLGALPYLQSDREAFRTQHPAKNGFGEDQGARGAVGRLDGVSYPGQAVDDVILPGLPGITPACLEGVHARRLSQAGRLIPHQGSQQHRQHDHSASRRPWPAPSQHAANSNWYDQAGGQPIPPAAVQDEAHSADGHAHAEQPKRRKQQQQLGKHAAADPVVDRSAKASMGHRPDRSSGGSDGQPSDHQAQGLGRGLRELPRAFRKAAGGGQGVAEHQCEGAGGIARQRPHHGNQTHDSWMSISSPTQLSQQRAGEQPERAMRPPWQGPKLRPA